MRKILLSTAFVFVAFSSAHAGDFTPPDEGFLPPGQEQSEAQALANINQTLQSMPFDQAHAFNAIQIMNSYGRAYVPTMSQTDF